MFLICNPLSMLAPSYSWMALYGKQACRNSRQLYVALGIINHSLKGNYGDIKVASNLGPELNMISSCSHFTFIQSSPHGVTVVLLLLLTRERGGLT